MFTKARFLRQSVSCLAISWLFDFNIIPSLAFMTKINTNLQLATGKVCINLDPHTTNKSLKATVGHPTPFRSAVFFAKNLENDNQKDETDFWAQQKRLATSISAEVEQEVKTLKQCVFCLFRDDGIRSCNILTVKLCVDILPFFHD